MTDCEDGTDILRIGLRQISLVDLVEADPLLRRAALLRDLEEADRLVLLASGRLVQAEAGENLSKLGELAGGLFFLLEGGVNLESSAGVEFEALGKGDLFGLDAVVKRVERFTARCESAARLAWFPGPLVLRMASGCPGLAKHLQSLAVHRTQKAGEGSDFMDRW